MVTSQYLTRVCPSCGQTAIGSAEVHSERRAESSSFESLVPIWNGFFKEKSFFSYNRCKNCKILFAPIFYTSDQLSTLYAQMPANMDVVPKDTLKRTQRGYFDTLQKYSNLSGNYLEIGPDIGLFTENCVREGNYDFFWLFEPNRSVENTLHKSLADKQHQIVHEMFSFDTVPDKSVSTAVMIHVLDHLIEPLAALKDLREKLAPNAKLLIVTHDEGSLLRKIGGWRWPAFCLQHPQLFNDKSIKNLLESAGFNVIGVEKTKNYFPVSFLVKHFLWMLGFNVESVPSFFGATLGLKLGNIITIATPAI